MSQGTGVIDKIKLPDGAIVDLVNNQNIEIPDLTEVKVYPQYTELDGTVEKITGTADDYLLTLQGELAQQS